jgi:hypothetical protein
LPHAFYVIKDGEASALRQAVGCHEKRLPSPVLQPILHITMSADHLDALIAASAHALDLPVDPAWYPAVRFNLEVTQRFAALVAAFPLPDDAEPAPVFRA